MQFDTLNYHKSQNYHKFNN
uniref:Uncharacterized protein n=1 Tax=Arundo donax TaxID=35708 RepID=A0A0A9DUG4_ARUDO